MNEKIKAIGQTLQTFVPTLLALIAGVVLLIWPKSQIDFTAIGDKIVNVIGLAIVAALAGWGVYLTIQNVWHDREMEVQVKRDYLKINILDKQIQLRSVTAQYLENGGDPSRLPDELADFDLQESG